MSRNFTCVFIKAVIHKEFKNLNIETTLDFCGVNK
jgi:hypothetical protein